VRVLVANAGSSSLKLRLLDGTDNLLASADLPPPGEDSTVEGLEEFVGEARFDAVGHRIVHGGPRLQKSVVIDESILAELRRLEDLAPLHNGPALATLMLLRRLTGDVAHIGCFDTAFHSTLPDEAALYAVPRDWIERLGVRRYGFHGLSHAYAARRTAELLERSAEELRIVTCHLGAGASLAAVSGGSSVDTTMGFTPNEGLVMATRSGSIDPGVLVWLQRHAGISLELLERTLEQESGLLGLSGKSGDMREILRAADADDLPSKQALAVYLHRLRASIAAMAIAMEGTDALVFTGGVGERSARVREHACRGLEVLGIHIDASRNATVGPDDAEITGTAGSTGVLVIHAREDLEIAAETRRLLTAER
jgi:acetate kinase